MPKIKKENKKANEETTKTDKKGNSIVSTLIALLVAIFIIVAIFGGTFYYFVHNNVNGVAEKYRKTIQNIPILRLALPAVADPTDPKYMTAKQILEKYNEYRKTNIELQNQLDELNKKIDELQKYKGDYDKSKAENDKALNEIKARKASLDAKQKQLDELKLKIDKLIASGDKTGFKEYFESVNSEVAKQVYADIVKQQQVDANTKKFAQIYQAMDASAAASIFEKMGNSKIDLISNTLKSMNKEYSAAILAAMDPAFASKVTQKLDALYKKN